MNQHPTGRPIPLPAQPAAPSAANKPSRREANDNTGRGVRHRAPAHGPEEHGGRPPPATTESAAEAEPDAP